MAKLPDTSLTTVAMGFFVANMERKLRLLFLPDSFSFVSYDFELLKLVISDVYWVFNTLTDKKLSSGQATSGRERRSH
jgi:hypothetical protein